MTGPVKSSSVSVRRPFFIRYRSDKVIQAYARKLGFALGVERGFSEEAIQKIIGDQSALDLFTSDTFCSLEETTVRIRQLSTLPHKKEELHELLHTRLIWQMRTNPDVPAYSTLRALPGFERLAQAMHVSVSISEKTLASEFLWVIEKMPANMDVLEKRRILDCIVQLYPLQHGRCKIGMGDRDDFSFRSAKMACNALQVDEAFMKGKRILGIGVVKGALVVSLREPTAEGTSFANASGIEINPDNILPEAAPHVKIGNAVLALPWPDEEFDVSFAVDVVGWDNPIGGTSVFDLYLFLRQLHRVTKPSGFFLVTSDLSDYNALLRAVGFEIIRGLAHPFRGTSILRKI